jgi:flagellar hook-length control protein FliK
MTPTNTDYLLQVTTPVTDRTYSATGASDGAGKFDDHLSQASTYSGDDSRNLGSGSQRTDTARYERDDRSWNTGASKPSSHDSGSSTSSQTSQSNQAESSDGVRESTSAIEDTDGDDHETDKSDDTMAAEVAGASQAAKDSSPKPGSKAEPNANANAPATAKAAAVNKKAAVEAGDRKSTGIGDRPATKGSTSPDTVTQHADEAAKLAASAATDTAKTSEEAVELQPNDSEGKQSKAVKGDAATVKSNKGSNAKNESAVSGNQPVDGLRTVETASTATKKTNETMDAGTTLAGATTTKSKSDADESSEDDSHAGLKNDTRAGAGNDASVSANKVDTAQLAGSIPSTTDASANAPSKGKDNEQATKPIVAKGEPAAAAFARMARNNVTGSDESTSDTNDLPQVDPSRFIGRVAKAFQTAQDRGGTLQLRLSPPELGALRIELNVKDGVMSASLQTETANARRLLLDHLPALRDRLAEQNIRVDRFDVDVRQEGSGSQADTRGSQQQQFQHQPDQPTPRRQAQPAVRTREIAAPERTVTTPNVSDAGLNLIV